MVAQLSSSSDPLRDHTSTESTRTTDRFLDRGMVVLNRRILGSSETFGDQWQVLVLGQEVKKSDSEKREKESVIHWIKSSRSGRFCGAKVKSTGENLFRLREHDLVDALDMLKKTPPVPAKEIVEELLRREDTRASRPTYLSEQHNEMKANSGQLSWGYIFTNIDH
ncbi:hypothetical protein N7539_000657 [Penicillium diatomitis]|uniref:Uncharacterized protein n=1 Tax=Penicillium diatomitis TaxID=2819901 RepID=A0A9W9XM57_9EURO|nr:uncharacterized protein N7539_000657 [Penicillium diatomitis]KAJ5495541.1 hypothetical protein N7539_000657 [Penicillium diatomitis]